jgi:hypothetical protein
MALIFDRLAICSLGMSCQTAMQIDANREHIEGLVGQKATRHTTPFDWIVCGPHSIARMISENRFFPDDPEAFSKTPQPRWDEMQCLYFHEEKVRTNFEELRSKWDHIGRNFANLVLPARKIFILSNTQNNLLEMGSVLDKGWSKLSDKSIQWVRTALEARFGRVELHCVVYGDHHLLTDAAAIEGLHVIAKDDSDVKGDQAAWQAVLSRIIGAARE